MDVAALSVAMSNHQLKNDVGLAMMSNIKDLMNDQGQQLIKMLDQANSPAPHPTLGHTIDIKL